MIRASALRPMMSPGSERAQVGALLVGPIKMGERVFLTNAATGGGEGMCQLSSAAG